MTSPQLVAFLEQAFQQHGVEKTVEFIRTVPDYPIDRLVGAASVLIEDGDPKAALPALFLDW